MENFLKEYTFPAIPMRDIVCYPGLVMHFDVARNFSINAVMEAVKDDRMVFLVTQKDPFVDNPEADDIYKIGVVCEIRQVLKTGENVLRLIVEGKYRARIKNIKLDEKFYTADVERLRDYKCERDNPIETEATVRAAKDLFKEYADLIPTMPNDLVRSIMKYKNPKKVFENIAYNIIIDADEKQKLLETDDILDKLEALCGALVHEIEVLKTEKSIHDTVRKNLDNNQREYYLREQMRVISSQLGDDDSQDEAYDYMDRIFELQLPEEHTDKLIKEAERLLKMSSSSQESFVIRNYLDTVLELPWNKKSTSKIDIKKAAKILDKDHYGLKKVKDRILESIAVHAMMPEVTGQILCLVGPPGVGKTSIGKSVAKALGRQYVRISLGGVRDEADIRGHRKTYIGAMPGRIINAIKLAKTMNPLILFDEIDKMGSDFKGDPASAMLEVLDSEQNNDFRDHYIELPFDLSKVMFITTANTTDTIPKPLLDRMEIIELTSYTREEKFHIAKNHLIPKQLEKHGLKSSQMKINDKALYDVVDYYTKEAGVRTLERTIASLCRKASKEIVSGNCTKVTYTKKNLESFLGARKYTDDEKSDKNEVGVVNGLAWTAVGGVLMPLEVLVLDGKGKIETTGSLGDVMKESAKLAVSYTRSVAKKYNIPEDFYKTKDIHIHAPEGAVPKDGPSAGVTMTTALVSALSGIPVRSDVAMTGEITLHGKVLPIGGLREKTMAAYKAEIGTVIIPNANKSDLDEVDNTVKAATNFIFASKIEDVLDNALLKS